MGTDETPIAEFQPLNDVVDNLKSRPEKSMVILKFIEKLNFVQQITIFFFSFLHLSNFKMGPAKFTVVLKSSIVQLHAQFR